MASIKFPRAGKNESGASWRFAPSRDKAQGEQWPPRRLLHVPTMTSYERDSNNRYNGVRNPQYNAISYTWGRFENNKYPAVKILGVTWKIPGIDPTHFSVAEFEAAIRHTAEDKAWIWLDIACIDQENAAIKLDEINRQAEIFGKAETVYAWVTPWTTSRMLTAFQTIELFSQSLGRSLDGNAKVPPPISNLRIDLNSAYHVFTEIAQLGWFTSLWTLQEAFLCHPFFLSRSCDAVPLTSFFQGKYRNQLPYPVGLMWLAGSSRNIWDDLRWNASPQAQAICELIHDSGLLALSFLKNAYMLYPAAAKRNYREPQDAVYGIMQVYNLRMPAMNDANKLLTKLALSLNVNNALGAQIFVHQTPPNTLLDAWKLARSSHVPFQFYNELQYVPDGSIAGTPSGRPSFRGTMAGLEQLASTWDEVLQQRRGPAQPQHPLLPFRPAIYLDATAAAPCVALELEDTPAAPDAPDIGPSYEKYTQRWPLRQLSRRLPHALDKYNVLYLGTIRFSAPPAKHAPDVQWRLEYSIGLLVRQEVSGKGKSWARVGFCSWCTEAQRITGIRQGVSTLGKPDRVRIPTEVWGVSECLIG